MKEPISKFLSEVSWRMPRRFDMAKMAGSSYGLRCLVFHNLSAEQSPFTAGIRVSMSPEEFEAVLKFVTAYYSPVSLDYVLSNSEGKGHVKRPLLVTFDDAYASVAEWAAPLCRRYKIPAVFFVNAAFIDNRRLAADNLVCYVAAVLGIDVISKAAQSVPGQESREIKSLADVFRAFFPAITFDEREAFLEALRHLAKIDEQKMAEDAQLYLTAKHLRDLGELGVEIGNHTYSHTYCRTLSPTELRSEVSRNKAELESITGKRIRAFSPPYGSAKDIGGNVIEHLQDTGHKAVFLSESVANQNGADLFHLDRVSTCASDHKRLFLELEVLPRLRATRNRWFRDSASHGTNRTQMSPSVGNVAERDNDTEVVDRRGMRA
jgi:peptidoglycan/xylan/chitin deacetylase (PgdA/CDA1 family)